MWGSANLDERAISLVAYRTVTPERLVYLLRISIASPASFGLPSTKDNHESDRVYLHPGSNVHRRELLEQQLRRIGHVHGRDPGLILTRPAFE